MTKCLASEVIDGKLYLAALGIRDNVWIYESGSDVGHRASLALIVMASYLQPGGGEGLTVSELLHPVLHRYADEQLSRVPLPPVFY